MTYLYSTDDEVVLMDPATFEQVAPEPGDRQRGSAVGRREPGGPASVAEQRTRPASRRPTTSSSPSRTPSPVCAATRPQGGTKLATLETGVTVQVPLFIVEGERVRVDTRTGSYITRV